MTDNPRLDIHANSKCVMLYNAFVLSSADHRF
jgi:hypothetical protein